MNDTSLENSTVPVDRSWLRYSTLMFMDTVFLILYITIMLILLRYRQHKFLTSYYVLVIGLGFADICILSTLYFFYTFDFWQIHNNALLVINFVSNSFGYFPSLYLNAVIAINRFFAIVTFNRFPDLFTSDRCFLLVLWAFLGGLFAMSLYQFLPTDHYVFYGSVITTLIIIFVCYTSCIVACFIRLRDQALTMNQRRQYNTEMKFMFQAMTLALIIVVEESSYHLTNGGLAYQILYMVYGGIATIVYLVTNSEIRNTLKNFARKHLFWRNQVEQVTVITH